MHDYLSVQLCIYLQTGKRTSFATELHNARFNYTYAVPSLNRENFLFSVIIKPGSDEKTSIRFIRLLIHESAKPRIRDYGTEINYRAGIDAALELYS